MTKILIIDDDFATTELLDSILRSNDFQAFSANYGQEGIELAKKIKPDLVILDLIMPGMDGWQITRHLRNFLNVPILVLSVIDKPKEIARILDEGADDYMIKPVPGNLLVARIKTLTRRAKAEQKASIDQNSVHIST